MSVKFHNHKGNIDTTTVTITTRNENGQLSYFTKFDKLPK